MIKKKPRKKVLTKARFKKLTPKQQRIEIAKDVLAALKAKLMFARPGEYVSSGFGIAALVERIEGGTLVTPEQLQAELTKAECHVCAIGAAYISKIRKRDGVTTQRFYDQVGGMDREGYTRELQCFSDEQLTLIEATFEGTGSVSHVFSEAMEKRIQAFHNRYETPDERLAGIWKNVLKNDGTLVLPAAK